MELRSIFFLEGKVSNMKENISDKLKNILTKDWPYSRKITEATLVHFRGRKKKTLSREFINETRDTLDHLYRVASENSGDVQRDNCSSMHEHLRRATVEPLEFHVEETLRKIRPLRIPRNFKDFHDIRRAGLFLWREYALALFVIRPKFTTLILQEIILGKKYLVNARRGKGGNMNGSAENLISALRVFENVSRELDIHSRPILFDLFLNIFALLAGIGLSALLKYGLESRYGF